MWHRNCAESLTKIKNLFKSHTILKLPDYSKPFIVYSDSFKWSLTGSIWQRDDEGEFRPVGYFSTRLKESDLNQSTYILELRATVEILVRYKYYLFNRFGLYVDNLSLVWSLRNSKRLKRHGTLLERLLPFNFDIKYVSSNKNVCADFISR